MGQAKKKKEIIGKYKEIEGIVGEKCEELARVSPLHDYLLSEVNGGVRISELEKLFNEDKVWQQRGVHLWQISERRIKKVHKDFIDNLTALTNADYAVEQYGIKQALEKREEAFLRFTLDAMVFSTEEYVRMLEELREIGLLGKITQARISKRLYAECEDLYNPAGRRLAEMTFKEVSYYDLEGMLKLEMEKLSNISSPTLKEHMIIQDAMRFDAALKKGEPFVVYRGFLIDPLDMVRGEGRRIDNENVETGYIGRKADGEEYFRKWNAGKGVSFSFEESVAAWFCSYQLFRALEYGQTIEIANYIGSRVGEGYESIWNKEEYIEYEGEKLQKMLDATGKKAIVCKLEVDPKKIKGFNFGKTEAEVNVLPEDAKVLHYEICGGDKIAERVYSVRNRGAETTGALTNTYFQTEVAIYQFTDLDGREYEIFADRSEIDAKINEIKKSYNVDGSVYCQMNMEKVKEVFLSAAIELPPEYNPRKLTKDFWDFLLRRPERKLRKRGKMYLVGSQ